MPSKTAFNVEDALDKCESIIAQLEADSQTDREKRAMGRSFARLADSILGTEESHRTMDVLTELGFDDEARAVADILYKWSDALSPMASVMWSQEEVTVTLEKLKAMRVLELLSEEQDRRADHIIAKLSSFRRGGSGGQRGERREQPPIEGRPFAMARVATVDKDTELARQAANKANSASNIKNAVVRAFEKAGLTLTPADREDILAQVKKVVEDGVPEVVIAGAVKVTGLN